MNGSRASSISDAFEMPETGDSACSQLISDRSDHASATTAFHA